MFQPQPTPFFSFGGYNFTSTVHPDYTIQQTPYNPAGYQPGLAEGPEPNLVGAGGNNCENGGYLPLGAGAGAGAGGGSDSGSGGVSAHASGALAGAGSLAYNPSSIFSSGPATGDPASFMHQQQGPQQQQQQQQQQAQQAPAPPPPPTFTANANSHHHRRPRPSNLGHSIRPSHRTLGHNFNPKFPHGDPHPPHHNKQLHAHPQSRTLSHPRTRAVKMEPGHDLAAQEAAAIDYQPNHLGDPVGLKTTSDAITEQYAKADPVYVEKTLNLPQVYSHYRPIQGDGNCGWRAVAFGYFETLISNNNPAEIEAELQRLTALNDFIQNVGGFDPYLFEDMADETLTLLRNISSSLPTQDEAMAVLLSSFNSPDVGNSILYHLRLLASSQFRNDVINYEPFLTNMTADKYREAVLGTPGVEIDHLGLVLLVDVLLKPAQFVLEVAYLDRSAGAQVNTYRLPDTGQETAALVPTICLLYRPTHYDLLYRPPVDIQVNQASSFSHHHKRTPVPSVASFTPMDMSSLSMLPSMGGGMGGSLFMGSDGASPLQSYTPSPHSNWMSSPYSDDMGTPAQPAPAAAVSPVAEPLVVVVDSHPLRMTKYCQMPEYTGNDTWREPIFTTASFRNSHYNKAHYNNPDFQPEVYNPDAGDEVEKVELPTRKKKGSMSMS